MPTFSHEDELPRVPLPTLEETADRFLTWSAPLLTDDERATTESAAADLLAPDSPAHALHADLVAYDGQPGVASWLDDFWRDRYLGRRDRIALNANFFFLFEDSELGQIERAAHLAASAVAFKATIDDETLPVVEQRGHPLSMHQNRFLFSATRIPGDPRDTSRNPYSDEWPGPSQERHVVVLHRGTATRLDVIAPDGRPYTADEIATALRAVVQEGPGDGVGALTSKARAEWAASRAALIDAGNAEVLDELERALFCLVLEDSAPDGPLAAADQLLHGDAANRWFDKAVSLVVFADGRAGINGEHCNLDGTTIVAFLDAILTAQNTIGEPTTGGDAVPATRRMEFVLDNALRADVEAARADFAAYAAATATSTLVVDFDAERAKALKCSPDAFAQLAFQLTHQRAKGHVGATYESIATRAFRHGRTEAMRVVTPEVVAFVAAMEDPAADAQDRRDAFRAAAEAHVARAKECQVGLAPEQHLWELQLRQKRQGGGEAMAVFDSPGWRIVRDDYLSTSAVPSAHIQYFGFGSTSEKCIGVGYAMLPHRFDLYLSTPRTVADQMAVFARELPVAVRELEELLTDGG